MAKRRSGSSLSCGRLHPQYVVNSSIRSPRLNERLHGLVEWGVKPVVVIADRLAALVVGVGLDRIGPRRAPPGEGPEGVRRRMQRVGILDTKVVEPVERERVPLDPSALASAFRLVRVKEAFSVRSKYRLPLCGSSRRRRPGRSRQFGGFDAMIARLGSKPVTST